MKLKKIAALIAVAGLSTSAFATNGYFSHGYGMKAKGMAGVGIALPQDALAAATNPAGITEIGDRLDVGVDWFMPRRSAEIRGNGFGWDGTYSGDGKKDFLIPEFGYNKKLGWDMAVGIAVYGNGGMNSVYNNNPFNAGPLTGASSNPGGVDLVQMFVAPTFAMKVNKNHSLGVSIVYGYQQFGASGLHGFGGSSTAPTALTNNGHDKSDGWGLRLGWTGKVTDNVTLGATYATKMKMSAFDKYKGLFAEQGDFDIPENYGIGIAVKATPKLTVAFDIQQINYSNVRAIANVNNIATGGQLGANDGPGFGWRDMTVYKLGLSYDYSKDLTLRGGFSTTRQPIPSKETMFNILAPGVVEDHLTLGATWMMANKGELTVSYMHAFKKTVNGSGSSVPGAYGGGEASIKMYQDSLGIGYGIKFD
jgi:long-chain fatty acid transport protein